jgi:hypothetical protein
LRAGKRAGMTVEWWVPNLAVMMVGPMVVYWVVYWAVCLVGLMGQLLAGLKAALLE